MNNGFKTIGKVLLPYKLKTGPDFNSIYDSHDN